MQWESVIGLEVHIQLSTASKLFSGSATDYGRDPNTQACALDIALPGTLPVLNQEAVNMAIKLGLAIDAEIHKESAFARKNYYYPDLPKGYQISQHLYPIITKGHLDITLNDGSERHIGITRAHIEEDAGKSLHETFRGQSGIDLNRAGMPLIEIVSEPDMRTPEETVAYLKTLHTLVTHLGICDGNLQEGSFRCDANVSVREKGADRFGTRTETKNLNSFRFVEKAIQFEIDRQINLLKNNIPVQQETLLYDAVNNETRVMRKKEEAEDYRYFPEPDLLPLVLTDEMIDDIRSAMPELPQQKKERFIRDYKLPVYDANILTSDRAMGDYFEAVMNENIDSKLASNWILGDLSAALNKDSSAINQSRINAKQLAGLLKRIEDKTISGKIAKTIFETLWQDGGDADAIIEAKGLKQVTDSAAIETLIDEVIAQNPEELAAYQSGKTKLFGFFIGQVMKASKGKANPGEVNRILKEKL